MKVFFNLCGMAVAGFLGYSLEPNLRFQLTGESPGKAEMAQNTKVILQVGEGGEPMELESLTPDQLPEKILINTGVDVTDASSGITMNIKAGNRVKLVRIESGNAIVSPGEGSYTGRIPVMDTDLLKQLTENPPVAKPKAPETPVTPSPEPTTPTAGESAEPPAMPEPPPVPQPAPVPEPAPAPEPTPVPEPVAPAPAPETPAAVAETGSSDVVKVMQDSIKEAQIKEFKMDQVSEWKAGATETVDGETFQTGTALYKAVTFLGEKTIEAKAFIKGGKVQRWIWPRSGMEIK